MYIAHRTGVLHKQHCLCSDNTPLHIYYKIVQKLQYYEEQERIKESASAKKYTANYIPLTSTAVCFLDSAGLIMTSEESWIANSSTKDNKHSLHWYHRPIVRHRQETH